MRHQRSRTETSKQRFGYYHLTTDQQLTTTQPSLRYEPDTLQWLQIGCHCHHPQVYNALQVTETELIAATKSFPAGSAGGPDSILPQHILDLTNNQEAGPALVTSLTTFINMLLAGRSPDTVIPVFFGGSLIALEKKCGGIRPIAIGYTLRRLAAKCANTHVLHTIGAKLLPEQLGLGTPGGCEAAVHATRRFLAHATRLLTSQARLQQCV